MSADSDEKVPTSGPPAGSAVATPHLHRRGCSRDERSHKTTKTLLGNLFGSLGDKSGIKESDAEHALAEIRGRKHMAWAFGLLGLAWVAATLCWAAIRLDDLKVNDENFQPHVFWGCVVLKAVITVTSVLFGYTLLKTAERLTVPRRFIVGHDGSVETLRVLLGMKGPDDVSAEAIEKVVKPLTELLKVLKP